MIDCPYYQADYCECRDCCECECETNTTEVNENVCKTKI